jgi:putative hydrolase of the HAD superfamily
MITKDLIKDRIRPLKPIPTGVKPAGRLGQKIACVLFDIYGTLFVSGSGDIGTEAQKDPPKKQVTALFEKYAVAESFVTLRQKLTAAVKNHHARSRARGIDFPEVRIEDIWAGVLNVDDKEKMKCFAVEYEAIVNPVYPMPHLAQVLQALKTTGVCLGLVSNAQFFTPYLFEWFLGQTPAQLGFEPDLAVFSYQHGVAKPSQALFEKTLNPLKGHDISLEKVLYVGNDMLNDIYPATKLGFQTALFAGDKRSLRLRTDNSRCQKLVPDITITDLRQLPEHLLHSLK